MRLARTLLFVACAALLLSGVARADDDEAHEDYDFYHQVEYKGHDTVDEQHVAVLTYENFTEFIESNNHVMVEFYAPWCHHCKNLKPEYAGAATEIAKGYGFEYGIEFAKVDIDAEHTLASKYNIEGVPTILFFSDKGKKRLEYSSEHSIDGIVNWVKRRTGPAATVVKSQAEFEAFLDSDDSVVFAYVETFDKYDWSAYQNLAQHDESHTFGVTDNAELAAHLGITTSPGLIVFKKFDNGNVVFEGEWDEPNLADFVELESMRTVTPFSADREAKTPEGKAFMKAKQSSMPWHVLMFGDRRSVHHTSPAAKTLHTAATGYRGKVVFFTVDTDDSGAGMTMDYFGVKSSKKPRIFMLNKLTGFKYELEGKMTSDAIKNFVDENIAGKGVPYKKSEPVPEEPMDGDVAVVVGKNFDDVVMDHTSDVLLEVYAHWCGFCQKFAPTYSKLGKRFKKVSSVTVAKMDGSLNEVEGLKIENFPTLFLYKANDKGKPLKYEGEKDVKSLTQWMMEHSSIPFAMKKRSPQGSDEL
ncbi:protein disulfide-isomerase [Chloropicon primus]|uniref:protein disulfide-isomerase n=1 Tax=Chloropicon primus TaxID=1764295 RepID=A0A5B8MII4_9CHLO|nr:protein disulfide-isomerase [Chloropicon primus]UPQ99313.1 protein disulfide-isomerase [Chloropicon primus]|eukprot:QDZ20101.1 protein disulfide-isomerase [Chloropicon primus]